MKDASWAPEDRTYRFSRGHPTGEGLSIIQGMSLGSRPLFCKLGRIACSGEFSGREPNFLWQREMQS